MKLPGGSFSLVLLSVSSHGNSLRRMNVFFVFFVIEFLGVKLDRDMLSVEEVPTRSSDKKFRVHEDVWFFKFTH